MQGPTALPLAPLPSSHPSSRCPRHHPSPQEGDVELAEELVRKSAGLQRTRELAQFHAADAAACVEGLSPPAGPHAAEHRAGLIEITRKVIDRKK